MTVKLFGSFSFNASVYFKSSVAMPTWGEDEQEVALVKVVL